MGRHAMSRGYLLLASVREMILNVALFVQCIVDAQHCNHNNNNSNLNDNKKKHFFPLYLQFTLFFMVHHFGSGHILSLVIVYTSNTAKHSMQDKY